MTICKECKGSGWIVVQPIYPLSADPNTTWDCRHLAPKRMPCNACKQKVERMDKDEIQKRIDHYEHAKRALPYTPLIPYLACCICYERLNADNIMECNNELMDVCITCHHKDIMTMLEIVRDLRNRVSKLEQSK